MKQKITTRLLATLLLTAGSLATIPLMTTALTSCTADELIEMQLPPAPSNPQLKPGEVTISLNVPAPAGFNEAATRAIGEATGEPDAGKTTWTEGDELMMNFSITGYEKEGEAPSYSYQIFTTATCTKGGAGDAQWKLSSTPSAIYRTYYFNAMQSSIITKMDNTFNPFGANGQFTLPAELERCTTMRVYFETTYAPGSQWVVETDKNGDPAYALSLPSPDATGTREQWYLSPVVNNMEDNEALQPILPEDNATSAADKRKANADKLAALFTLDLSKNNSGSASAFKSDACGRLRIATFPGATVQIASNSFAPTAAQREYKASSFKFEEMTTPDPTSGLNLYTTTADGNGNAYFYGLVGTKNDLGNIDYYKPTPIDGENGNFIVSIAGETIFQATKKAPVSLATGKSVKIDGNTALIEAGKVFAVDVKDCTDAAALTSKLVAAYDAGSTMWTVTGTKDDKWSGGSATISSNSDITSAILNAMNTIYSTNPGARISLLLPTIELIPWCAFNVNDAVGSKLLQSITALAATSISNYAFDKCAALTSVNLPLAAGSIGEYAFRGCAALTSINMPLVKGSIGNNAFKGCEALTTVNMPAATSIGNSSFENCTSLTSVNLPLAAGSIEASTFNGCEALTSIDLPLVTGIGENAFNGCAALTSIDLPKVTSIGSKAFYGCAALTSIELKGVTDKIGMSAFQNCKALTSINLPKAEGIIDDNAFKGCAALTSINMPGATSIGSSAFSNCISLTSIIAPLATSIGNNAFANCKALNSIDLKGATSISMGAFTSCAALESINLPVAETIGGLAFNGCAALTTAILPKVTNIGGYAFQSCAALETLSFGSTITWGSFILEGVANTKIENITLTLAAGQKNFNKNGTAIDSEEAVVFGEKQVFAGYTFKEIKKAP